MKEFEVGMYVRYTRGAINGYVPPRIGKIVDCSDSEIIKLDNNQIIINNDVKKASYNIIDLIEVGDYVNGYKVTAIYKPNGDDILNFTLIMEHGYKTINPYIRHYPIKSIVTKEQFDSMKYGGDKEY